AAAAVLRLAGLQLDVAGVGPDAEVAAAEVDHLAGLERLDAAAAVAVGAVDPVVQAPDKAVDAVLLVALHETGVEDNFLVGLAVAVGVLGVEDVRGAGDQHTLAPRQHAGRVAEVVEEDGRLVVLAGAPGVFEELDLAAELALAIDAERVVAHLDDPELAVRPPGHRDRVFH